MPDLFALRVTAVESICVTLQALDKQLPKLDVGSSASAFSMENVLAEVEDLLSYCNDILCTGIALLTAGLIQVISQQGGAPTGSLSEAEI